MKTMPIIFLMVLIATACASAPQTADHWRHQTKGPEQYRVDVYDCDQIVAQQTSANTQAGYYGAGQSGALGGAIGMTFQQDRLRRRCMTEKFGWQYVGP